ncbi:MAG TPA: fumarylacetoacetate hydrolase family protein [Chloroflexota bacterium]|nr:fumarylacetoacetate hydrolase family protein [Chloroflexota bacterium]
MPRLPAFFPASPALCRFRAEDAQPHLGWWDGTALHDLSATGDPRAAGLASLLATQLPLAQVASDLMGRAPSVDADGTTFLSPIDHQEVWAAGVTYERSREAREQESETAADMYARVYDAERPELFFKADARRVVGPDGAIMARPDARWTVPEPELTLVLDPELRIAGYTIGNDVSSRDIEGENPLYLPQAKVYMGACALGPWIVPAESLADPYDLRIECAIVRAGAELWRDTTSTAKLHRRLEDLVAYLGRSNTFPDGAFLLTGTCLVPPDTYTLVSGDVVEVGITGLGLLRNIVG